MNVVAETDPSAEQTVEIPPKKTFPERMRIVASAIITEWKDKDVHKLRDAQRRALTAYMNYCETQKDSPFKGEAEADLAEGITIFRTALTNLSHM